MVKMYGKPQLILGHDVSGSCKEKLSILVKES